MKIGKYKIYEITTGRFALDGGAMYGVVPKTIWEKSDTPDTKNRLKLVTRNLLLVSDSRKILIDTGLGTKWEEKYREIYQIDQTEDHLENGLKNLGFSYDDITDVLLTHLHFDHTGGSTRLVDGKIEPTFKYANYYVQKDNFEWALNPTEKDRASYLIENFEVLAKEGMLRLLDEKTEKLDDEISVLRVHGHTRGQQIFKIADSSNSILFGGDLFPTKHQIALAYVMSYDLQPLITLQEKKFVLANCLEEGTTVYLEHDYRHAALTLKDSEKGIIVSEVYNALPE